MQNWSCPLRTPVFPPVTYEYDPERHNLIDELSKCMIKGEGAQTKFGEYRDAVGTHEDVYTARPTIHEIVGAAAVIKRHFQNGETTCHQLPKKLLDNSTTLDTCVRFCWVPSHCGIESNEIVEQLAQETLTTVHYVDL